MVAAPPAVRPVARVLLPLAVLSALDADHMAVGRRPRCAEKTDPFGAWHGSTEPGGEYTLTCNEGFAVDGEQSVTLTCSQEEVQWPANPWCENVDDCSKLVYGCGPAGLCIDHVGHSECRCEKGATRHRTSNGEVVCFFRNEAKHCGGRNCGAHGICVDLTRNQDSFDTGMDSFRCSCERGFYDDGSTCVPFDCGPREDPLGTWSGDTTYNGEYTLECREGAALWGGSLQAITITCPADGVWKSRPFCLDRSQLATDEQLEKFKFWANVCMAFVCVCCAALAAGLTMGLLSVDERELQIIQKARLDDCNGKEERERLQRQKDAARRILPILKDHHLLLVTLLLLNALANEALPIFLDELMPPFLAVLVSVTFVVLCGEIIPAAIFTGPMQLDVAKLFVPGVKLLQCLLWVVAKPIAMALDRYLPHHKEQLYSRAELKAVIELHSQQSKAAPLLHGESPQPHRCRSVSGVSAAGSIRHPVVTKTPEAADALPPLSRFEADLCFYAMRLEEVQVAFSVAFLSVRACAARVHAAGAHARTRDVALKAARTGKEAVVIFTSLEEHMVAWPVEVPVDEIMGVQTVSQLMAEPPGISLGGICTEPRAVAVVRTEDTVANALHAIANAHPGGCPGGFAVVVRSALVAGRLGVEFAGLFDGSTALLEMLGLAQAGFPHAHPPARQQSSL